MHIFPSLSSSLFTRSQARAILAALVVILSLVINTLACSYSDTSHWYETVSYQSPTPNTTSVYEAQLTATQMVGKVNKNVGKISVTIVLDPLNERDVKGVNAAASDLNTYLMVETFDPQGRYLPDLEIVPKSSQYRDSQQTVIAEQVDKAWTWSFKLVNGIDISQVKSDMVGTLPLDQIGSSLSSSWPSGQSIHFILPVLDKYNGTDNYDVFRTPGNATLLLMPSGVLSLADSPLKLARPMDQLPSQTPASTASTIPNRFLFLNFTNLPDRPLTDYTSFLQNLTVGNYLNLSSADLQWGDLKVNELGSSGLPKNYTPPKTVTTDFMTRFTTDQQFVNSLYYITNAQSAEPCTKNEQLNRVLRQDPPAGTAINGLKSRVNLVVCNQVLSQSKYLTAVYQSPTPTPTITPRPTNTVTPSLTPSSTITFTPSSTPTTAPSNTPLPTNTPAPTSTDTTAPTSTTGPTSTTAPTSTTVPTSGPTPTNTSTTGPTSTVTPVFDDEFISTPLGYNANIWTIATGVVTPALSWPLENTYQQIIPTTNSHTGDYTLVTNQTCLYGDVEFRVLLDANSSNNVVLGWEDPTGNNGIYVTAPEGTDRSKINFKTIYNGVANLYKDSSNNSDINLGSSANGVPFVGKIVWGPGDTLNYTSKASLFINNSATPYVINDNSTTSTFLVPHVRMKFIIRNNTAGGDYSLVNVDYVRISNCH